jgi:hypothetical protein
MTDHSRTRTKADPLSRLLLDLDAMGRLECDDHVPASARVEKAIGRQLSDVVRRTLLGPEGQAMPRPRRVA